MPAVFCYGPPPTPGRTDGSGAADDGDATDSDARDDGGVKDVDATVAWKMGAQTTAAQKKAIKHNKQTGTGEDADNNDIRTILSWEMEA